jgi:hypothetical protein
MSGAGVYNQGMPSSERARIPEWAQREREQVLAWLGENTHVLLPAAKLAFEESGRGAVIVDTNTVIEQAGRAGNPMFYLPAQEIARNGWLPAIKMVQEYDASWEFVTVLLKKNRESAYRVGVPSARRVTQG